MAFPPIAFRQVVFPCILIGRDYVVVKFSDQPVHLACCGWSAVAFAVIPVILHLFTAFVPAQTLRRLVHALLGF